MGSLAPVAFDIETSGLSPDAEITVAGLAFELGEVLMLNTTGRPSDTDQLTESLTPYSVGRIDLHVCTGEQELLQELRTVSIERIDSDGHYLTAFHGETWNGGFDLPMVRTACADHDVPWPFPAMAYADMMDVIDRFDTNDRSDLVGIYEHLIGRETCDPFDESGEAVAAFNTGDWEALLKHNLADIQRTRELAVLAGQYVPKSDFRMKNLAPPET